MGKDGGNVELERKGEGVGGIEYERKLLCRSPGGRRVDLISVTGARKRNGDKSVR